MAVHEYNRAKVVDRNFGRALSEWHGSRVPRRDPREPVIPETSLRGTDLIELFESQVRARHLDLAARELRAREASYYTIGSAGHEGNAVLGRLTRPTDPALLHYRSGAFMMERARFDPSVDAVYDTLLGTVASREDPSAGGRHKVWGSAPLWVIPQTSTIASHLPKAVGMAVSLQRAVKLGLELPIPADSVILCSFGDATVNHSTALGAFNAASWAGFQRIPVPVLFVCEDNGLGISVRTPPRYVEETFRARPGIRYLQADGLDLIATHRVASEAIEYCRRYRRPVFLHLRVVRLLGHAGTDHESEYRGWREIEEAEVKDPLLRTLRTLLHEGLMTASEARDRYEEVRGEVRRAAERAVRRPKLETAAQVCAPIAPYDEPAVRAEAGRPPDPERRERAFEGRLPETRGPKHLAALINLGLHDLMAKYPEAMLFGEDVAQKGGVYHVTSGLHRRFRAARVFNTLLDEQTILGLAQGAGYLGLLPIPEIQYLAYFHNAEDQVRGEACSTQFFSNGRFRTPMVIRIAALAYQKGFGGHFHNDNSVAALRDIPGLVIACPSRGDDAVGMLRTAAALARVDGRVVAFLEPIALYMTKDLHAERDRGWTFEYPALDHAVPLAEPRVYDPEATDLLIVTYGNGVPMSLRAARTLRDRDVRARVLDLRWLAPLDEEAIAAHATACGRVLVVDEGRRSGGVSEAVLATLLERVGGSVRAERVVGEDTFIPLGPAAHLVLPDEETIVERAARLVAGAPAPADS